MRGHRIDDRWIDSIYDNEENNPDRINNKNIFRYRTKTIKYFWKRLEFLERVELKLNFEGAARIKAAWKIQKTRRSTKNQRVLLVRPEGFEPPAFWSVAFLRKRNGCFPVRLAVSAQDFVTLEYCLFHCFRGEISCSGSVYGSSLNFNCYSPFFPIW